MVKIYLSINNNEEIILLPVTPESYELKESWENQEVAGLYKSLNFIKYKGLSKMELASFFPVRDYPFLLNRDMWGMDYVEKIRRWQTRKLPLRFIALNDDKSVNTLTINIAVTIDDFSAKASKDGDIYYTLSLTEFTFIEVI